MQRAHFFNLLTGAAISLGFVAASSILAPQFAWDIVLSNRPIALFATFLVISCLMFTAWFWRVRSTFETVQSGGANLKFLAVIFMVGLIARMVLLPSNPILEDDHYRYLWDGAVRAEGLDPYAHPPAKFATPPDVAALSQQLGVEEDPVPAGYSAIADAGEQTLLRVNNPHIATIYPPPVQAVFAFAYRLSPFSLSALKMTFLCAEILSFIFLYLALRAITAGPFALTLYWWHPLVLKEFANSAHMDSVLIAALSLALWLLMSGRHKIAAAAIGLAAAVKFWPAMLMAALFARSRMFWIFATIGAVVAIALTAPQLLMLSEEAGLVRYSGDWQRNALIFAALEMLLFWTGDYAGTAARFIVTAVLVLVAFTFWRGRDAKGSDHFLSLIPADPLNRAGLLVLLLCLLSPTGYPWYAIWLLPFAVLRPSILLITLPGFAGFYYYDFLFQAELLDQRWAILPAFFSAGPAVIMLMKYGFMAPQQRRLSYGLAR